MRLLANTYTSGGGCSFPRRQRSRNRKWLPPEEAESGGARSPQEPGHPGPVFSVAVFASVLPVCAPSNPPRWGAPWLLLPGRLVGERLGGGGGGRHRARGAWLYPRGVHPFCLLPDPGVRGRETPLLSVPFSAAPVADILALLQIDKSYVGESGEGVAFRQRAIRIARSRLLGLNKGGSIADE